VTVAIEVSAIRRGNEMCLRVRGGASADHTQSRRPAAALSIILTRRLAFLPMSSR